ncbi:MAG TPA: tetratricopeptide repeat protein [Thermoanaerobaculia bacterium]|nr:tetratricopeptide repeat protein [Thermoanaerobaculia bacterium]
MIESLVLDRLGQAQAAQGKNDAAELSYLRSLVLRLGTEEQGAATAETLENLADLYYQRNQPEAGLRALRQSLAVRERSFGPRSPEAAQSLSLLGTAYRQLGRFEEAEQLLRRAGAILREAPQDACVREELSLAWNSLAELLAATGRDDEAERLRQEALRVLQPADCPPSLGEDPASLAPSRTATRAPPATRRRTP